MIMKRLLVMFFLTGVTVAGWSQAGDSVFLCMANWKKGSTKTYSIMHRTGSSDLHYEAAITVLDSNANGYTLQWVLNLSDSLRKKRPYLVDSLPVYGALTIVYYTDAAGAFRGLRNWEEVRNAYVEMMEIGLPKNATQAERELLSRTEAQYRTREAVEADLIREIKLFHEPYGRRFGRGLVTVKGELPNPWMSDRPLPALTTTGMEGQALRIEHETDSARMMALVEGFIQKMGSGKDSVLARMKEEVSRFSMYDLFRIYIRASTGWPGNRAGAT